jgi:glycerate-2-kinase
LPSAKTKVRIIEGGLNNLPDDSSHRASNEIVNLLSSLNENDVVLALISGKKSSQNYI